MLDLSNNLSLLSSAYMPNIQYVSKLILHRKILIEIHDTYQKQSYRNRCTILGANGLLNLSIPVVKPYGKKTKTKDILIDYSSNWQHIHWQAIRSAYGNSPFFETFEGEFNPLFEKQEKYLIDFNEKALYQIFYSLGHDINLKCTDSYYQSKDIYFDYRDTIHPKSRMHKPDLYFTPVKYYQVFEEKFGFMPNLSFLDLMFNEGAEALSKCKLCITQQNEKVIR